MNVFSETVAATRNKYKYWNTCMINIILLTDVNPPWMQPVDLDHINATCPPQVSLENYQSQLLSDQLLHAIRVVLFFSSATMSILKTIHKYSNMAV